MEDLVKFYVEFLTVKYSMGNEKSICEESASVPAESE